MYARKFGEISNKESNTTLHSRKSQVSSNNNIRIKKNGDTNFDVTMGSFNGAGICELVGVYLLRILGEKK